MIKQLCMEITGEYEGTYQIKVTEAAEAILRFNPETKTLSYDNENELTAFLKLMNINSESCCTISSVIRFIRGLD